EVEEVAKLLGADAVTGDEATSSRVACLIEARHPRIIYLATHGLSDEVNPLDGSKLWLSDGNWPARKVSCLSLTGGPLVVLRACRTGLGKTFDVGTIGMSRAWFYAGASAVVMSLWRVDDNATRALMTRFIRYAQEMEITHALQRAMLDTRVSYPSE